jgi:hypothetical protein
MSLQGKTMSASPINIDYEGKQVLLDELLADYKRLRRQEAESLSDEFVRHAVTTARCEEELVPYRAELIQLQNYLEETQQRMIFFLKDGMPPAKAERYDVSPDR